MASKHPRFVRVAHWIMSSSLILLVFTGYMILMVHPRLYWGEAGNDLVPALLELPISRNHQHGGWEQQTTFVVGAEQAVSASRTFEIFNQNGWARSLHFLAGWIFATVGLAYFSAGLLRGHFRSHVWPRAGELAPRSLWRDVLDHLRLRIRPASGGPQYGALQKCAYTGVVFVAAPLMLLTGLAMSPAVTAAMPWLLSLFGGFQSARTIHFFTTLALVLFLLVHVAMVVKSGFRRQMRAMTFGRMR